MQDPRIYFKYRIKLMKNNHPFRYPKWKAEDIAMVQALLEELDKKEKE